MGKQLPSTVSPDPVITEFRQRAISILNDEKKPVQIATKDDIRWFWADFSLPSEAELAEPYVLRNLDSLSLQYPFILTEWMKDWYGYMPDPLAFKWDKAGQIDWNLFISLAYPLPGTLPVPFFCLIRKVNTVQRGLVREQIYASCYSDLVLRNKVLKGMSLPPLYTYYAVYSKIRKEVVKRMRKNGDTVPPFLKSKNEIFKEARRLIKRKGLTPEEAFIQASTVNGKAKLVLL